MAAMSFYRKYRRCSCLSFFVWAVLLVCFCQPAHAGKQVSEYHVKAVFLYNLTHFVSWPAQWHADAEAFVIGIYGNDPFGTILDETVAGERFYGKPIIVRRYATLGELRDQMCDILFIGASATEKIPDIKRLLQGAPVLMVADTRGFAEQGGMVNLVKKHNRVTVEINRRVVNEAGLAVSSKLLRLARIVR